MPKYTTTVLLDALDATVVDRGCAAQPEFRAAGNGKTRDGLTVDVADDVVATTSCIKSGDSRRDCDGRGRGRGSRLGCCRGCCSVDVDVRVGCRVAVRRKDEVGTVVADRVANQI